MADKDERRDEKIDLISLILTSRSLEELQLEMMRYLSSNPDLLLKFLRKRIITFARRSDNNDSKACSTLSSPSRSEDIQRENEESLSCGKGMKNVCSVDKQTNVDKKCNRSDNGAATSTENLTKMQVPKKRRKSKYVDITGDLSHICREPKRCKYRDKPTKGKESRKEKTCSNKETLQIKDGGDSKQMMPNSHNKTLEKNEEVSRQQTSVQKNEEVSRQQTSVQKMIEILRFSKSSQEREDVLCLLRADPELRDSFLIEKARLGKMKIPVLENSRLQVTTENSDVQTAFISNSNHGNVLPEEGYSSASSLQFESESRVTSYLGKLIQSIIRSKLIDPADEGIELNVGDLQLIANAASLDEQGRGSNYAENRVTSTRNGYLTLNNNHNSFTTTMQDTTFPFQNVIISNESKDNSTLNISSGEVFGDALHEHFQQLACDQYAENNPFILENNEPILETRPDVSSAFKGFAD